MPLTKDKYFELIDSNSDYPHFRCALGAYIPGSLYKYFSIPDDSDEARKRFEQLKSGEIWFSKRSGLNDPFEFEHIALKGAQNDARQYYLNKQQELEVCCFSALLYNKLMWSHYAAGYKGYCVEFRVESPERFYPVIYENEVPDLSQEYQRFYDMRNEMCANPSLVLNNYENRKVLLRINYPLFSKDTCWSYEEEYRILDSSTVSNGELQQMTTNGLRVTKIIAGAFCTDLNFQRLKEVAGALNVPLSKIGWDSNLRLNEVPLQKQYEEKIMDKLKMETSDMAAENIEKIGALFPSAVTEMRGEDGSIKKGVNFEMLKQLLSPDVVEEGDERYEFTWVGKKQAIAEAARPTTKTLRPVKEDSRNWDATENLYIEGDNLEVLKILQESYLGKVKMIYIDPPYNTGHDFIYRDDFGMSREEWSEKSGELSEDGDRLFENTESNGRFHSDWCSMTYSRLMLARNLLTEDGVVFISLDDGEIENLREICNEVFGEQNFLAQCVRKRRDSQANLSKNISPIHEYVVLYAKSNGNLLNKISAHINERDYKNPDNDPRGPYKTMPCTNKGGAIYSVMTPSGKTITEEWRFKRETYDRLLNDNRLVFPRDGDGKPRYKLFLSEKKSEGQLANTWLDFLASNQEATREIKSLFGNSTIFSTPKPVELIKFCMDLATKTDSIVLDFFSGSATTAHAVMQLNAEDGGHRKFIMVQLPEPCDENSEAFKAGYKNICEIGKERIRRAGEKIKEENPLTTQNLDIGFRVFRVDESNMKNVYYHPEEVTQLMLGETVSNIKEDRTDLDLLYACLLDWGVEINLSHTSTQVAGCTVHNVDNGALAACFDKAVPRAVVEYIANLQPLRAVFRDSAFATDAEKINVTEIFKNLSPDTKVKVI